MKFFLFTVTVLGLVWVYLRYIRKLRLFSDRQQKKQADIKQPPSVGYGKSLYEKLLQDEDSDVVLGLKPETKVQIAPDADSSASSPIIVLHVVAPKEQSYAGYELLQTLLSLRLKFGEHRVFHYYEDPESDKRSLFYVTTINKPGTFDLSNMGGFSCPGLSLFIPLNVGQDNLVHFELMLETAKQLVEELGGEIWDEKREELTTESLQELRHSIQVYEEGARWPDFLTEAENTDTA